MISESVSAPLDQFEVYLRGLSSDQVADIEAFLAGLEPRCTLPRGQTDLMRQDFQQGLLHYARSGVALDQALERLDLTRLGGFYARPPRLWFDLDDAAKIYPLSMRHGQMKVFRLSVRLRHAVVPELLQLALNFTITRFPTFATTVKKGVFWHYLDAAKRRYAIQAETAMPCQPMKIAGSVSPSFRVLYWTRDAMINHAPPSEPRIGRSSRPTSGDGHPVHEPDVDHEYHPARVPAEGHSSDHRIHNRISVEFFHVLTDGHGGLVFLKTLVAEYLRLCGFQAYGPGDDAILDINAWPDPAETVNEFNQAPVTDNPGGFMGVRAVQMSGRLARDKPSRVLHFVIDAAGLKAAAQARAATVTAYVVALMLVAGRAATDEMTGDINIQVPVNLRQFYPSRTLRNFSTYCGVRLPLTSITSVEAILPEVTRQLRQKASKPVADQMLHSARRIIRQTRWIPLALKAPIVRIAYRFLDDTVFSNTLSNLGVVTFPPGLASQIEALDFVLDAPTTNRAACALVTCADTAILTITKTTTDPSYEDKLYALLQADGIPLRVEGTADWSVGRESKRRVEKSSEVGLGSGVAGQVESGAAEMAGLPPRPRQGLVIETNSPGAVPPPLGTEPERPATDPVQAAMIGESV